MGKFIHTTINEYFDSLNQYRLLERARINNKVRFPYDVFVYGGTKYGHGRQEHGEPHFHYSDDIDSNNAEFKFSVRIPEVDEWKVSKELEITESSTGKLNWKGFSDERDDLILWLDRPHDEHQTNLEYIRSEWNTLNVDNSNVRQIFIPKDKEKEEIEDAIIYKKSKKGKNSRLL